MLSAKHVEDEAVEDMENKAEMNETEEKQVGLKEINFNTSVKYMTCANENNNTWI